MNDDIMALADRLLRIEARLYALEGERESTTVTEPLPAWRRLVDEAADRYAGHPTRITPLGRVLYALTRIELKDTGSPDPSASLAGIVAVCEAQVGGGWQADPDNYPWRHVTWGVAVLLEPLSNGSPRWDLLGNRAAAWLRDLTEADA